MITAEIADALIAQNRLLKAALIAAATELEIAGEMHKCKVCTEKSRIVYRTLESIQTGEKP